MTARGLLPTLRDVAKKALTIVRGAPVHPTAPVWDFFIPMAVGGHDLKFQYAQAEALRSSVVVAVLNWMMRTFPEAPAVVERREGEQWHQDPTHPLAKLLHQPNPYYSGRILWMATVLDFAFGEAFWWKVRNELGQVIELWWMPRALVEPKFPSDGKTFISHYVYTPAGVQIPLNVADVVHFRFGMDPNNVRRGFSQLAAVMREVYTDDQASQFTASILRNLGIVGVVLSPKQGVIASEEVEKVKKYVQENFTGEKRGQAMAFARPTELQVVQYNLQGVDLGPMRDIAEERVCAATGIPAAVIGFGTGLQQTKVGATMRENIQQAYKGCIMPTQDIMADEVDRSLITEWADPEQVRMRFDTSKVRALWEDEGQKTTRVVQLWAGDLITRGEARRELGYAVDKDDDVFHSEVAKPEPPPAPPGNGQPPPGTPKPDDEDDEEEA